MLIGLVSAKGSPGVTTAALALAAAWPRPAVVVDADPFGGDVRAGLGSGSWPPDAGITELVVDLRSSTTIAALPARLHRPAEHAPHVLAGVGCVGQGAAVPWATLAPDLGRLPGTDCIADCGRFVADLDPLLRCCAAVVLVTGSSLREARSTARIAQLLTHFGPAGVVVSRPDRPYSGEEVASGCGLLLMGELPDDPRAARVWSDGDRPGRTFGRAALTRAAGQVAERLAALPERRGAA